MHRKLLDKTSYKNRAHTVLVLTWFSPGFDLVLNMTVGHLVSVVFLCCSGGWAWKSSTPKECMLNVDLVFLIDGSTSVRPEDFRKMLDFISSTATFLSKGQNQTKVGVVQFGSEVYPEISVSNSMSHTELERAIRRVSQKRGGTNTGKALNFVLTNSFLNSRKDKVLILITDGDSQDEVTSVSEELRKKGVQVYVIGFGDAVISEMLLIASSYHHIFTVSSFDSIKNIKNLLYSQLCAGAYNQTIEECSLGAGDRADVVLLVDGSWSLGLLNFRKVTAFLEVLVNFFGLIGPDNFQISLVQYSNNPHTAFYLDAHHNLSSMVKAIQELSYQGGQTHTGQALTYVRNNVFQTSRGARANVPRITILITDGASMDPASNPATRLRDADVEIFAVGVKNVDFTELMEIVSAPAETHLIIVNDFNSFSFILKILTQTVCHYIKQMLSLVQPKSLRLSEVQSRAFRASWEIANNQVEQFLVKVRALDDPNSRYSLQPVLGGTRSLVIQHLSPQTLYEVKVYAKYQYGLHLSEFRVSLPETAVQNTSEDLVRLTHGPGRCSGSVELLMDQSWTPVCEKGFGRTEAEVVCRELDCGPPADLQMAWFTEGKAMGWSFQCEGMEVALKDCESFDNYCDSAVNLTCEEMGSMRLVNQFFRCAGLLELRHQNQWRPVMAIDRKEDPNLDIGTAVCAQMDCGSAVSVQIMHFSREPMWQLQPGCVELTSVLTNCVSQGSVDSGKLEVVCSDLITHPNISASSDGVSQAYTQGLLVQFGSDFTMSCFIEPHFPEGRFQLISPSGNYTLPTVNYSAHFWFPDFSLRHSGEYTCVYLLHVFSQNFSLQSQTLYITRGVLASELLGRALVALLILLVSTITLYFYCKATKGRCCGQL